MAAAPDYAERHQRHLVQESKVVWSKALYLRKIYYILETLTIL